MSDNPAHLFHIAFPSDWRTALDEGVYTVSTRGRTLEQEGFIHLSSDQQWPVVRSRFYGDVNEDLLLLEVDPARLSAEICHEVGDPATGETFPHLYGPLEVDAVVTLHTLAPPHGQG